MERYNLDLYLHVTAEKKLNIGIGGLSSKVESDIPFHYTMNADGTTTLTIPGSSLKGVLRTSLIKVAGLLGRTNVSHSPHPEKIMGTIDSQIFGEPGRPSKVTVEDTYLNGRKAEIQTHVKINDKTRTAEEGALFTVSYLPIGNRFTVHLKAENLTLEEARLLLAAIVEMNYERIGRAGVISVKIDPKSRIPDALLSDPVISLIWGELKDESI